MVFADIGVRIAENSALEPDVVVARVADAEGVRLARPPVLVVEVLSPHSVLRDLNLKKAAYERFGIPSYWAIDPDLDRPSLRAYELDGGSYAEVAHVAGSEAFRASKPFDVRSFRTGWSPSSAGADHPRPAIGQVIGRALAGHRC